MLDVVSARVKSLYEIVGQWETTLEVLNWVTQLSHTELKAIIADYLDIPREGWTYPVSSHSGMLPIETWRYFVEDQKGN